MKLRPRHFQKNFNLKLPSLPSLAIPWHYPLWYTNIVPFHVPYPLPPCRSLTMHLDAITDSMASNNAVTIKLKLSRPNGTECAFKHLQFTRYFRSHYRVMKYRRHNCTPFALVFFNQLIDSNFRSLERSED